MGTFSVSCQIENPVERSRFADLPPLLVDTRAANIPGFRQRSWKNSASHEKKRLGHS